VSIFVDFTGKPIDAMELKRCLLGVPYVNDVVINGPLFAGFTAETTLFPLTLLGNRAIVLRKVIYESLLTYLDKMLGSGYKALLYHVGVNVGRDAFKDHEKIVGRDPKALTTLLEILFRNTGYGVLKILELNEEKKRVRVRVYNCFECEIFKKSGEPSSSFIRGFISGWFT